MVVGAVAVGPWTHKHGGVVGLCVYSVLCLCVMHVVTVVFLSLFQLMSLSSLLSSKVIKTS